jgi:hypothetical protein
MARVRPYTKIATYARSNPSRSPQYCPGTLEACSQWKRPLKLAVTEFLAEKKRTKAKKNHEALKQVLDLFVQVVARNYLEDIKRSDVMDKYVGA